MNGNGKHLVDAFNNPIRSTKPRTALYSPGPRHVWGTHPRDLPLFDFRMIRYMLLDPTIILGLKMRMAPIITAEFGYRKGEEWEFGVKADREEVKDFVERQLHQLWTYDIHKMLDAQVWGWSSGEVMYKTTEDKGTGDARLEFGYLKDVHPADANTIRHDDFGLVGVQINASPEATGGDRHPQRSTTGRGGRGIGDSLRLQVPGKAFWHAFNADQGSDFGISVLKGSYSAFADKWFDGGALDVQRLYMHTDAYSGRRIGYPPGTMNLDGKGDVPNRDIAREMVEQYKSGDVMTYPLSYDQNGRPMWVVEDAKSSVGSGQHILQYPKDLDISMLRGMVIPDEVLTTEMTGAWAGKKVPMLAFYNALQGWGHQLLKVVDNHIMQFLVEVNFGPDQDYEVGMIPFGIQAMKQEAQAYQMGAGQMGMGMGMEGEEGGLGGMLGGASGGFGGEQQQEENPFGQGPFSMSLRRNRRLDSHFRKLSDPEYVGSGDVGAADVVDHTMNLIRSRHKRKLPTSMAITPGQLSQAANREYATALLSVPLDVSEAVESMSQMINPKDVVDVECDPHVTVLQGLHDNNPEQVMHVVRNEGSVALKLGCTDMFQNEDNDVVIIPVESHGLHRLHEKLRDSCPNTQTYDTYQPHITVAYVTSGCGCQYTGLDTLNGVSLSCDFLTFSNRNRSKTEIELKGPVRFSK